MGGVAAPTVVVTTVRCRTIPGGTFVTLFSSLALRTRATSCAASAVGALLGMRTPPPNAIAVASTVAMPTRAAERHASRGASQPWVQA
jgi:hypothetical protein